MWGGNESDVPEVAQEYQAYLAEHFEVPAQALLVFEEHLDEVIDEADGCHPDGTDHEQDDGYRSSLV